LDIVNFLNSTGKASLYKRKSNKTIDPVPMVTVAEYLASGDFSAGITISGLELDNVDGAVKVEVFDFVGDADITIQTNAIATNANQELQGSGASATATPSSPAKLSLCESINTTSTNSGTTWMYLKSGQNRPCLNEQSFGNNAVQKNYQVINNTLDEVNSFLIQSNSANSINARFRISVPKGTLAGSWTLTEN
jgi:hypothetical protein